MFLKRLLQAPRILALTLVITFVSGANFFSIIMFWPTQAFNVCGHDPVGLGLRGLPARFSILAGAVTVLLCLSVFGGRNKESMIVSSILMTDGCGALACANRFNLHQLNSLDLAMRVIGGSIGYTVFYNILIQKFVPNSKHLIGGTIIYKLGIKNATYIGHAIEYTGASLLPTLRTISGIGKNEKAYQMVVLAGQVAFAESYKYVCYASIAFEAVSIVAACFLGNVGEYMDDHVTVVMH
ncbi:related to trichothecene efflux pump [Rhynchosporium secalis]|uniref:Related to trichothecene efflux pump n=1 Tax=Rhynchosporium secalis TaxID=38038 RepID=A0A1E1M9E6_RHYSE|nr:related to trichothecene efflux pump [Rhynchosporium secalis]